MIVILDCEGPITKNDNALELCKNFIPDGGYLFEQLSAYDDLMPIFLRNARYYETGKTLQYIIPFLKAFGADSRSIEKFCKKKVDFINGSKSTIRWLNIYAEPFIVSTSYNQYIKAVCKLIDFSCDKTYNTRVDFRKLRMGEDEKAEIINIADRITSLAPLKVKSGIKYWLEVPNKMASIFLQIDGALSYFWKIKAGKYFLCTELMGSKNKAKAIWDICLKTNRPIQDMVYIGDSITDVEAFKLVRKEGGLTISFNGNRYALEVAEFACISNHNNIIANVLSTYNNVGKEGLREISNLNFSIILDSNLEELVERSEAMRKRVRGDKIGSLG